MSNVFEQDTDIIELMEVLSFEDMELDNDIQEWLQSPPIQLKDYVFEAEREDEYFATLYEISEYLMER